MEWSLTCSFPHDETAKQAARYTAPRCVSVRGTERRRDRLHHGAVKPETSEDIAIFCGCWLLAVGCWLMSPVGLGHRFGHLAAAEAPRCMTETRRWSGEGCIPTGTVGTRACPAGRGRQDANAPRVAETMTKARRYAESFMGNRREGQLYSSSVNL